MDQSGAAPILELAGVGKQYGRKWALEAVDLVLHPGQIIGFVGPNGAGKTTLLKVIMGLIRPSRGNGSVVGQQLSPTSRVAPHVGIMLERPPFIEHLSGLRNLSALASIRNSIDTDDARRVMGQVGLDPDARRPVRTYSQGMRQRLAFAQAVMEDPPLLLLDEPTNGLDPHGIVQMRESIRSAAHNGTAVLLASHLLSEVEAICDEVILVESGKVIKRITRGSIAAMGKGTLRLVTNTDVQPSLIQGCDVRIVSRSGSVYTLETHMPTPDLVRSLVADGIDIEEIGPVGTTLEDVYLETLAYDAR